MNETKINKIIKPNYKVFIVPFLMIVIGVFLFNYSLKEDEINQEEVPLYGSLISQKKDTDSIQRAKVKIIYMSKFAYKGNLNFYIAEDEYEYIYILRITDSTFEKMKSESEKDPDNFSYEIYGFTHKISDDIKKLAIEKANKIFDDDLNLNESNYEDYFGNSYLDETISKDSYFHALCVGIATLLIISSLIGMIFILIRMVKIKIALKKIDIADFKYELSMASTQIFEKEYIYLTDKHVISTLNGLKVFNYDDIVWLYNEKRRVNGINIGTVLNVRLNNKKLFSIAYSNKNPEILDEIMNKILLKNNKILIGFTKENKKKFKEYK